MGVPKMTGFIIGAVLVSLIAISFGLNVQKFATSYNVTVSNTTLQSFQKLDSLYNASENTRAQTDITIDKDFFDIIGGYFTAAYKAVKVSTASVEVVTSMSSDAVDKFELGAMASPLKTAIITIIVILIFVGILIAAMIKRDT